MTAGRPRLVVATTIAETAWTIMRGQLRYLNRAGFDVELISSPSPLLASIAERECIEVRSTPMARELAPLSDLKAVVRLVRILRAERPDIIFAGTPKAGLLLGVAGYLARSRRRIYLLRGLRLETERGVRRALLWLAEWVAIHTAHEIVAVSNSLLARTQELRLVGRRRGIVLGSGASTGVDLARFEATSKSAEAGAALRKALAIPSDAFVFGFVGRLVLDKGVSELVEAFARLCLTHSEVWLLMVGAEELSGLPQHVRRAFDAHANIRFTGWLDDTVPAYSAMNCLVLPTYREGFPNVPLEAAAAGCAVITTTATGAVDSVKHRDTGLLVPPRSIDALQTAMSELVVEPDLAAQMGRRGRAFVSSSFANEIVWSNLANFLASGGAVSGDNRRSGLPRKKIVSFGAARRARR